MLRTDSIANFNSTRGKYPYRFWTWAFRGHVHPQEVLASNTNEIYNVQTQQKWLYRHFRMQHGFMRVFNMREINCTHS